MITPNSNNLFTDKYYKESFRDWYQNFTDYDNIGRISKDKEDEFIERNEIGLDNTFIVKIYNSFDDLMEDLPPCMLQTNIMDDGFTKEQKDALYHAKATHFTNEDKIKNIIMHTVNDLLDTSNFNYIFDYYEKQKISDDLFKEVKNKYKFSDDETLVNMLTDKNHSDCEDLYLFMENYIYSEGKTIENTNFLNPLYDIDGEIYVKDAKDFQEIANIVKEYGCEVQKLGEENICLFSGSLDAISKRAFDAEFRDNEKVSSFNYDILEVIYDNYENEKE